MYKGKIQLKDLSKELQAIFANVASGGGGIAFLRGTTVITQNSTSVQIPMVYDSRTDTLLIHRNSTWMEIKRDYTINSAGTHINIAGTDSTWHASTAEPAVFNFILLKAVPASDIVVDGAILVPGSIKPDAISEDYTNTILKYTPYWCGTTTGNMNYSVINDKITSYYEGLTIKTKIGETSTGQSTININNLGAKIIKDSNGNQIKANGFKKDAIVELSYNSKDFILQGKGGGGNATPANVLNTKTFTNDDGEQSGTMPELGTINKQLGINETFNVKEGHVNSVNITQNIATKASQTYTPGKVNQTINANQYLSGPQTILGDQNLVEENIVANKEIFGIRGTATAEKTARTQAQNNSTVTVYTNAEGTEEFKITTGFKPRYVMVSYFHSTYNATRWTLFRYGESNYHGMGKRENNSTTTTYSTDSVKEVIKMVDDGVIVKASPYDRRNVDYIISE